MVIVILPIIIFGAIFIGKNITIEKKNIYDDYGSDAIRISGTIDSKLKELKHLGETMSNKVWVKKLMVDVDIYANEFDIIKNLEIREDFQNLLSELSILSSGFIVYPEKNLIVSPWGQFDNSYFFTSIISLNTQDQESLYDSFYEYNIFKFMQPVKIKLWGENKKVIPVVQSLEIVNRPRAVLVLFIDSSYLTNYIQRVSGTKPISVSIMDNNSEVYKQVNDKAESAHRNSNHILDFNLDSYASTWKYKLSYPNSVIPLGLKNIFIPMLITFLSLIAGTIAAFFFAKISYKPIYTLFNKVVSTSNKSHQIKGNSNRVSEYNMIENSFNHLIEENNTLQQTMKDYKSAVRCNMIIMLLKGYFEDEQPNEKLKDVGLDYTNEMYFCTILINFNYPNIFSSINGYKNTEIATIVTAENIIPQYNIDYQILGVINADMAIILSSISKYTNEEINKIVADMTGGVEKASKIRPDIVSSTVEKGFIGISKSYYLANGNMQRIIFHRDNNDISDTSFADLYYYPTDWEIQLINNLKIGNNDTLIRILDEIKTENISRQLPLNCMQKLSSLLMETMLRVLTELNIDGGIYSKQFLSKLNNGNVDALWNYIYEVGNLICERSKYSNNPSTISLGNKLLLYVNNNYTSIEMSLKKLAEVFNMSVSSISKIFKEVTGINFYDYICRLRMEMAKELLRNNSCDVNNIANMVGYENTYSFKRAFIRYEGIKPDEYILYTETSTDSDYSLNQRSN